MIKYLGELYNYRVVDSVIIFRTLYLLITFAVNLDASEPSEFDPPEHLFRIRLVCTLLDTCGQYFDRGTTKKRLDCFLLYFQVRKIMLIFFFFFFSFSTSVSFLVFSDISSTRKNNPFGIRQRIHFHWKFKTYSMNALWNFDQNFIELILMQKLVNWSNKCKKNT